MTRRNNKALRSLIYIMFLLFPTSNKVHSQNTLHEEINQVLIDIDTLESDSVKLWTLFNLAGRKYRYVRESRILLDRCRELASKSGDPIMVANYQYAMGNYFYYNSLLDSSRYYLEQALSNEYLKTDPFLHSQILATQSGIQKINGQVSLALATNLEAKRILDKIDTVTLRPSEKTKRLGQMSVLDNSIGTLYHSVEDYDMAITHYQNAYDLLLGLGDLNGAGTVMGNIGEMYLYSSAYDKAMESLQLSLELKETGKSPARSKALTLFNMGRVFRYIGKTDTALVEFNRAIEIFKEVNYLDGLTEGHLERGLLFLETGDYVKALKDCEAGLELATVQSNVKSRSKACDCLYRIYKQTGNDRAALDYYEQYIVLKDSLFNAENVEQLTRLEMQYDFDQERDLKTLEADVKQREYLRVTRLLVAGVLVSLLIAFLLYYLFNLRKRANRILALKNEQISKALGDKQFLLKEIHHRVKNNLQVISSLLSLQSRQLEDPKAREAIQSGRNRVKSMALIHQKLYQDEDLVGVDVVEYIEKLAKSLVESYRIQETEIKIHTDVDQIKLDVDTIIPIGLILNELISNALKYAFEEGKEGTINVLLKKKEHGITLKVSDDGQGLPETFSIENSKSLGYRLIRAFAEKLKATLTVEHPPAGTTVSMLIPNPKIL